MMPKLQQSAVCMQCTLQASSNVQNLFSATYQWMTAKDRRPSQNPVKAKQQDYFKGVLF
jgi:hypothetical protein